MCEVNCVSNDAGCIFGEVICLEEIEKSFNDVLIYITSDVICFSSDDFNFMVDAYRVQFESFFVLLREKRFTCEVNCVYGDALFIACAAFSLEIVNFPSLVYVYKPYRTQK
jgi:hypothetical protein